MHMVRVMQALQPRWGKFFQKRLRVLDLGIGTGQWGFLFRNYLDYAQGRIAPSEQKLSLIGVEGFEKYRTPAWGVYNEVIVGDIREVIASGRLDRQWDFINIIEVIEHFDREEGARLLRWIAGHSNHMMFSFHNGDQKAVYGNDFERHRAKWSIKELEELVPGAKFLCGDDTGAYLFRSAV